MKANVCPMLECTASFNEARQLEAHMQQHFTGEIRTRSTKAKAKRARQTRDEPVEMVNPISWTFAEQVKLQLDRLEGYGIDVAKRTVRATGYLVASRHTDTFPDEVLVRWVATDVPRDPTSLAGIRVAPDEWRSRHGLPNPLEMNTPLSSPFLATLAESIRLKSS
jgi:hypothetical protein